MFLSLSLSLPPLHTHSRVKIERTRNTQRVGRRRHGIKELLLLKLLLLLLFHSCSLRMSVPNRTNAFPRSLAPRKILCGGGGLDWWRWYTVCFLDTFMLSCLSSSIQQQEVKPNDEEEKKITEEVLSGALPPPPSSRFCPFFLPLSPFPFRSPPPHSATKGKRQKCIRFCLCCWVLLLLKGPGKNPPLSWKGGSG